VEEEDKATPRMMRKEKVRAVPSQEITPVQGMKEREKEKKTTTGPGGRERKRVVKLGEVERRRARDEKFGVWSGNDEAYDTMVVSSARDRITAVGRAIQLD